jgi:spermidine synthase
MEWYQEDYKDQIRFGLKVKQVVYQGRSEFQTIDVVDTDLFGRALALNGCWMTSERDEAHYHEMIVLPAFCSTLEVARVLVIGGGDGGTVREVLRHLEAHNCTMVEIDQQVIDVCKEHLTSFNVPWTDPRLQVLAQDGVAFLHDYDGPKFNVIIIDGSDPVGPAGGLYESPFYKAAKRCLVPGGVLVTQSESPIAMPEEFSNINRSLRSTFRFAFPYIVPIPLYPSGMWSFHIASDSKVPIRYPREAWKTMKYYNADTHSAAFALPNFVRSLIK